MGIFKSLTKTLTSWYNEKEAQDKSDRTEALGKKADKVATDTDALIRSYRKAGRIMAGSGGKNAAVARN